MQSTADNFPAAKISKHFFALRAIDIHFYDLCERVSGAMISLMLVFSPWAFGTTQHWSIWVMNCGGYALGFLLLAKNFIRNAKKYSPPRWTTFDLRSSRSKRPAIFLTRILAALTLLVLIFCLVSAWNAKATYDPVSRLFDYRHCLEWLPHSFDANRSWFALWMYLGLAFSFWAICDWLSGMTARDQRRAESNFLLSGRLRWILWLLCVNGTLLGIEGILQRATHSSKVLFLVQPLVNPEGESQFGPYAYRANAAQYFNLLWPLAVGFWWTLQRAGGSRGGAHHILLFGAAIMAACPMISTSRGGALVTAGIIILAAIILTAAHLYVAARRKSQSRGGWKIPALLGIFLIVAASLGWYFGWDLLEPRMEQLGEGFQRREDIYEAAAPMAVDYPLFGTGPGTFGTVFQLYRFSSATYWPEQLHNDWLETRITFGWLGFLLILAALACIVFRPCARGGILPGRRFLIFALLALGGCLVHARYDFPFQIHSTLFLFLLICAMIFNFGRRSRM